MQDDYEDHEEQLGKRFEDLCVDLCIEGTVKEQAWDKYKEVSNNYCIDGDQLQWLVCALYECVRKSTTDNINSLDNTYVSLDRLLSASKMSFVQFFHRIRKWADMNKINDELRHRIERIENQFSVSSVIYDKYCDAFYLIFQKHDETKLDIGDEKLKVHFNDDELFKFTWLFYIKVKTNFPAICGDIILSFQLLLCALDWVASNAIMARIKYILNPKFKGLPPDFYTRNWKADRFLTLLKPICEMNDMNYIDCKSVRDSYFRYYVEKLIEKEILRGSESRDDNVLNSLNFDSNSRTLLNLYAEYMMASGDFDERIYLNPNACEEIGSTVLLNKNRTSFKELNLKSDLTPTAVRYMQEVINCGNIPGVIDTRKSMGKGCPGRYVNSGVISRLNGGINFNNYDSRVMNSNYLMTLLSKRMAAASEELTDMLQTHCFPSPMESITVRIEKLSQEFLVAYGIKYIDLRDEDLRLLFQKKQYDPLLQRCQTIHKLYYYALEFILKSEVSKIESRYKVRSRNCASNDHLNQDKLNNIDINGLLKKDEFHIALFAMCSEIVLVASDANKHFPWILDVFELQALHFYKIVEIFLRCVDLPRELVKYFNQVTENIVDSIAWKSMSVLWNDLTRSGKAPSIEEVTPPDRIEQSFKSGNKKLIMETNRERPSTKSSSMLTPRRLNNSQQTNSNSSSNLTNVSNTTNNRNLSANNDDDESARAAAHLLSSTNDEDKIVSNQHLSNIGSDLDPNKGFIVRHDSLALFFRQIYYLSSLRLRDLCDRLHLNRELMCKIWTTFEYVIIERTHLLKDRCLDQIILCCIYGVTKVASNRLLPFHEILQMYRMQPQSARHIYREVLIEIIETSSNNTGNNNRDGRQSDLLTDQLNENDENQNNQEEIRDDIIRFYNNIFLPALQSFIKRFLLTHSILPGSGRTSHQPHLSPMPSRNLISTQTGDPHQSGLGSLSRKVSCNKNVFVSPAKSCTLTSSSHHHHHHPHSLSTNSSSSTTVTTSNLLQSSTATISSNTSNIQNSNNSTLLSPKRVTFTVNSSPSKELRDINAMIAAAASKMKGGLSFGSSAGGTSISSTCLTTKRSNTGVENSNISYISNTSGSVTGSLLNPAKRLKFD